MIFPIMAKTLVAIPTYNEQEGIATLVHAIRTALPEAEIWIIDGNSPDGTGDTAERLAVNDKDIKVIHQRKKNGLGGAYMEAFERITPNTGITTVVTMDADFSHNPHYLPAIIKASETHDLVIGSRYTKGGKTAGWPMHRKILSTLGNAYIRLITGMPFQDCTSGFMAINTNLIRAVSHKPQSSGFAFLTELKGSLWHQNLRWKEIPIVFTERRTGISKINSRIIFEGIMIPLYMRFGKKRPTISIKP
jgi:dolichol-phosphate mannosyltransferase